MHLQIIEKIEKTRSNSLLAAAEVRLVAASKQQPQPVLEEAIKVGISDFGENRVQEAVEKWPSLLEAYPHARLHLIGALQTNKAMEAVRLFHSIQSVDREKCVDALAEAMQKQQRQVPCFIQVNTGEEPQKAGVLPKQADALIAYAREQAGLPVVGLMCVPPADSLPAPHFALLRTLAHRHGLHELSMGMSQDYETAIRFGATQVRIGTALFGKRPHV